MREKLIAKLADHPRFGQTLTIEQICKVVDVFLSEKRNLETGQGIQVAEEGR